MCAARIGSAIRHVDQHGTQSPVSAERQIAIDQQRERLKIERGNLALYLRQQAQMGSAYVTPGIMNGIRESRAAIRRIKTILRDWGVTVENHPDDEA